MTGEAPIHYSDYISHYTLDAYDLLMPEEMGHFYRSLEKRRLRLISGLVPGTGVSRILDAGCGNGWLSEMLDNRGLDVTALNLGLNSMKRASARLKARAANIPFLCADIYNLPCSDSRFDAVVISEVIEHLEKPQDALNEIARVVKPGGFIIVSTPYREHIEETLCIHCNRKTPVNAHLHSFDKEIMERMLTDAGFVVQKFVTFTSRPAERLGMAGVTFFLPFFIWYFLDAVLCRLFGRECFMAVRAVRCD